MLDDSGYGLQVLNLVMQLSTFQCTYCILCEGIHDSLLMLFIENAECCSRVLFNHEQSFKMSFFWCVYSLIGVFHLFTNVIILFVSHRTLGSCCLC